MSRAIDSIGWFFAIYAVGTTAFAIALRVLSCVRDWLYYRAFEDTHAATVGIWRRRFESSASLRARVRLAVAIQHIEAKPHGLIGYSDTELLGACPKGTDREAFLMGVKARLHAAIVRARGEPAHHDL